MRLARVTATLTATVRDSSLISQKLLLADIENASGKVLTQSIVAADACGAGVGDLCVLVEGSSARVVSSVAGRPVDACLVAIIDRVENG